MLGIKKRPFAPPKRNVRRLSGVLSLGAIVLLAAIGIGISSPACAQDTAATPSTCAQGAPQASTGGDAPTTTTTMMLLLFTFLLAIFLGVELIAKVPSQLHTPLMSGSNAISGITIVGAIIAAGHRDNGVLVTVVGIVAMVCASINVAGGYLVTDRMLRMFKGKEGSK